MTCPNCHHEVSPGAVFCGNCGYQLVGGGAPAAPAGAVPTPPIGAFPPVPPNPQQSNPVAQPMPMPVPPAPPQPIPVPPPSAAMPPMPSPMSPTTPPQPMSGMVVGAAPGQPQPPQSFPMPPANGTAQPHDKSGRATTAFVCAMLGLVGWLIPIVGITLGVLALVFGAQGSHSRRRSLATAARIIAIPVLVASVVVWVIAIQKIVKSHNGSLSGSAPSVIGQSVTTTRALASANVPRAVLGEPLATSVVED